MPEIAMRPLSLAFLIPLALVASCQTTTIAEREIEQRGAKGIAVGEPKVYDDSVLQEMLTAAETRLAALQVIDQTGITGRLGTITGATEQVSSIGISALGRPTADITTTANGATETIGQTGKQGETPTVTTTNGAPVVNTVTKQAPVAATAPGATAPSTALPTSLGVSASDLLNEQLQLTYEIANLRLLLDGALNDRLLANKNEMFVKPRVTLGFPISIAPTAQLRDAVAIVEAEVETVDKPSTAANITDDDTGEDLSGGAEAPAITAILPRDKTYNVASITESNTSIGAGVVTQVATVGASFLHAHKAYYIVKDQDTVAATFRPVSVPPTCPPPQSDTRARAGFAWQFRPVLGQSVVQAGLKQTFVQLSFPSSQSSKAFGKVYVRTYWRRYDKRTGVLQGVVPGSLNEYPFTLIKRFPMEPNIKAFGFADAEDLGNGQMLVRLNGRFLSGTFVRIGSTILQPGSPGFSASYGDIRFIAPIIDLATKNVVVVARDGTPTRLRKVVPGVNGLESLPITVHVEALDETNSRLTIDTPPPPPEDSSPIPLPPLVLVIGGKVFGYSDAPLVRTDRKLSILLPTAFLAVNRLVTVKRLFVDAPMATEAILPIDAASERLVLVDQGPPARYLFYGRDLDQLDIVLPATATRTPINGADPKAVQFLDLTIPVGKQLVVRRPGRDERPFTVPIPQLTEAAKITPKFTERITVGADDATIVGEGLGDVKKIIALDHELTDLKTPDGGKSLHVRGLAALGITAFAKTVDCKLVSKDDKSIATIPLEIVNSKVEAITH